MRTILFDLDGTLLDTLPDIALSLNETLAAFGYPACTDAQVRAYIGDGAYKFVKRAVPAGADADGVYAAFLARYGKSRHELTRPYEGMKEVLLRLKERGFKLIITTNKPQEAATFAAEKFYAGIFDFVAGDSGDFPVKPDPTLARYCALLYRTPPAECAVVGDGEADIGMAKNAGMRCVSVLWGYRTRAQLIKAGAETFAESPAALEKILMKF